MSIYKISEAKEWSAQMRKGTRKKKVKWEEIEAIIEKYSTDQEFRISTAFPDGGLGMLMPRLDRAAMNQVVDGDATFSRYAIWANKRETRS